MNNTSVNERQIRATYPSLIRISAVTPLLGRGMMKPRTNASPSSDPAYAFALRTENVNGVGCVSCRRCAANEMTASSAPAPKTGTLQAPRHTMAA